MVKRSPYISKSTRLADVVAAIQVMGTYKFYKLDFNGWADRITGDENNGAYWKNVFEEHPEFFRLDSKREKASLVWRRQFSKRFDVDHQKEITREEFYSLSDGQKERITRNALSADSIEALIKTAIDLHEGALMHEKEKRWWIPLAIGFIGALVGALIGAFFKK